jgi:hypothetical protein
VKKELKINVKLPQDLIILFVNGLKEKMQMVLTKKVVEKNLILHVIQQIMFMKKQLMENVMTIVIVEEKDYVIKKLKFVGILLKNQVIVMQKITHMMNPLTLMENVLLIVNVPEKEPVIKIHKLVRIGNPLLVTRELKKHVLNG